MQDSNCVTQAAAASASRKTEVAAIEEENKKIVEAFVQALGHSNLACVASYLAEDVIWIIAQTPDFSRIATTWTKAQWLLFHEGLAKLLPDGASYTAKSVIVAGNRVTVEVETKGKSIVGPFHRRYRFLFEVYDGKIIVAKAYAHTQ
jgi:ketosteroid isomerase-like protein